jgi:AAA domain
MLISKFKVSNYKSYLDSETVEFKRGFNVITGQNNSGKTALLEALSLRFRGKPHRSAETLGSRDHTPDGKSRVEITFQIGNEELLRQIGRESRYLPVPPRGYSWPTGTFDRTPGTGFELLKWVFAHSELSVSVQVKFENDVRSLQPAGLVLGLYP